MTGFKLIFVYIRTLIFFAFWILHFRFLVLLSEASKMSTLPPALRHHQSLLSVMYEFFDVEYLTDVSITSSEGSILNAHRKILAQVSPVVRKFVSSTPVDQRMNISLPVSTTPCFQFLIYQNRGHVEEQVESSF